MTLSLPWSSFEHMAGNWLTTQESMRNPRRRVHQADLGQLVQGYLDPRWTAKKLLLPETELREVLDAGRQALVDLDQTGGDEGVIDLQLKTSLTPA